MRGDEPGGGYRILVALDRVKRRGEEMKQQEVRRKEGELRKRESESEKWSRGFYTP